ncbi:hypothetical protein FPOAC2_03084 [Fusarium poae]
MRLDACSPKDGRQTVPGRLSLHSPNDIIIRLTTSQRVRSEMMKSLEEGKPIVKLFFLPFIDRMGSTREYRVYCAPVMGTITAVSQYCWHQPWFFTTQNQENSRKVASNIWGGIQKIHQDIMEDLVRSHKSDGSAPVGTRILF